jgi:hypothetical protein
MQDFFGTDSVEEAIIEFADELGRWLSAPMYCFLLNRCAVDYDPLRTQLTARRGVEYWAREVAEPESSAFDFTSWAEVIQLSTTTTALPYVPTVELSRLVAECIQCIEDPTWHSSDYIRHLWKLEQQYELTRNAGEVLSDKHFTGLLARAIVEEEYARAERIIDHWDLSPPESELEAAIEQAKAKDGEAKIAAFRDLLPTTRIKSDTFQYIAASYFRAVDVVLDYPPAYSEVINRAQSDLHAEQGRNKHARTAQYWSAISEGDKHSQNDDFEAASTAYDRAVKAAIAEYQDTGQNQFTNLGIALRKLFESRANTHRTDDELSIAIKELERGLKLVSQINFFSETDRTQTRKQLEALKHEYQADEYLQTQQLQAAKAELGQAIELYHQLGVEEAATYLKNRRRGLAASQAEQAGDYADAIEKHEAIADDLSDENSYGRFHQARGHICKIKTLVVERNIQTAREKLNKVEYRGGVAGDEIEYLKLLLSVLEDYENGSLSNMEAVLEKLDTLAPLDKSDSLHIRYGHDYRPVFITLLSAQRLRQLDIDDSIPESLVDLSLKDVLRPTRVDQVIEQQGLSDIGLETQWKSEVPLFTLSQYQQAKKDEAGKIDSEDFKGVAESLTGLLEEFLEFIVAYEARLNYGSEWHDEIGVPSGDPSLQPLVDALNKPIFENRPWIDSVRERLGTRTYSDIVLPKKDGTIVDLRNDLAHNNISKLTQDEYLTLKEDIRAILDAAATEIPLLGRVVGKNAYGAYTIRCFRSGYDQEPEILTDAELSSTTIYYFPSDIMNGEDVVELDKSQIVPCQERRILESVGELTEFDVSIETLIKDN